MVALLALALLAAAVGMVLRRVIGFAPVNSWDGAIAGAGHSQLAASMYRTEARASLTALILGVAVAGLMCMMGSGWTQGYGLPFALAGSAGTIAGLLAFSLYPRPTWTLVESGRTVAELQPRSATSFARQWVFALPLASAIMLMLCLVLTGVFSATDENGLHRVFQRRSLAGWGVENGQIIDVQYTISASGPFPGWYYGIPVIVGTILTISVVCWSLRRIASTARPPSMDLFGADGLLRMLKTTFVMAASSSALAFHIAGLAAVAGSVLRSSHRDPVPTADLTVAPSTIAVEPGYTLALILILASLVVAVAAAVLLVKAITVTTSMRSIARKIAGPHAVPAR
ncbi:hypothetical protein E2F48_02410 [Arthrobacter crusticola]|uniref:Uncharacterized protein n=1 Tax=Arthrobacter crusticola TaxID=2547960 RepID=A0A4R5U2X0_9MICC|nr:hypothetical protein [Arthrobacter crusticola]TDK27977.1 hypothetical protein E2F48_02410 [Arthrobacter crusticola]